MCAENNGNSRTWRGAVRRRAGATMTAVAGVANGRASVAAVKAHDWGLLGLRLGGFAMLWTYHVGRKLLTLEDDWRSFPDPLGVGHPASLVLALLSEGL